MNPKAKLTASAPILLVRDVVAAANHYRDAMGFGYEHFYGDPPDFVILHRDGMHLMLRQAGEATPIVPHWKVAENLWGAYFWVDDADALHAEFLGNGARIDYGPCDQPYGCREFGIQDLDGHDVGFGQVVRNRDHGSPLLPDPPASLTSGEVSLRFSAITPGNPAQGRVPFYHFRVIAGGTDVGHLNFRVGQTPHVLLAVGHIGYEIDEAFRGRGHALHACLAAAPFIRRISPEVILTCDPANPASKRTIERLGAIFLDEVIVPPDDPHFQSGARLKRRYRWCP